MNYLNFSIIILAILFSCVKFVRAIVLHQLRSSPRSNCTMLFCNDRRETIRWRIFESLQHSTWHFARMLLECSWELLQNAMAWILNYVCRGDDEGGEGRGYEKGCERSVTEGRRGLLRRHWESMPSKGQHLLSTEILMIATSSFLLTSSR